MEVSPYQDDLTIFLFGRGGARTTIKVFEKILWIDSYHIHVVDHSIIIYGSVRLTASLDSNNW